jgi:quercetin dioxygenase-like cupin family protein
MTAVEVGAPFELIVMVNDFAPGAWTPPHSHGGPNLITVLAGEITLQDDATGEKTVYRPGEFWAEDTTDVFAVGNDGTEDARVVAAFLLPEGASLTTSKEGIDTASLPPGPERTYRSSMPVREWTGSFEVIVAVNDFAPGAWTPPHSHGGPNLITVLAGEISLLDDTTGEKTVYRPGEAWIEETTDVFSVGNDGGDAARVVAVFLLPENASLTTSKEGIDTASLPPGPERTYRSSMLATTPAD